MSKEDMLKSNVAELIQEHTYCEYRNCPFCYAKANYEIQDKIDKMLKYETLSTGHK